MQSNLKAVKDGLAREVAAATRILVAEKILDYSGHVTTRLPDDQGFLIQTGLDSRAELRPERLLVVDYEGNVLEGEGNPPAELALHVEMFRARPDIQSVLHCHMDLAIAFTMMKNVQLKPMRARAVRWESGIPTHPDPSHIKHADQAAALAKTLGPHHAVLMRAHGLTLVAESVPALLVDAVHFQENALAFMQVLQAGAEPMPLTEEELVQINRHEMREFHIGKLWNYYVSRAINGGIVPANWNLLD
ncbi:MAG: class II aldolase/adducin family protein [Beijerinckiaceae bacterium]|jgi:L-ribulose-5-phosphate 4-epimerase|nr:class II aldolase/adducin family protein [Beijerinckiaceae bacterium]MDO9439547.1 class II aldolase/adducin family protein [Beijerinckiaceae bacterium]